MRIAFHAPNAKEAVDREWRNDLILRATGALTCHGGSLPGKRLAQILGISPRGLRPALQECPWIRPQLGPGEHSSRWESWYVLTPDALPKCLPAPANVGDK